MSVQIYKHEGTLMGTVELVKETMTMVGAKTWLRLRGVTEFTPREDDITIIARNPLDDDTHYQIFDTQNSASLRA